MAPADSGKGIMEAQQQLFGLMAVAEEHQKAVKDALAGLATERAALARERAALAQAAARVVGVADDVKQAAAQAVPALRTAAGEAVEASVRESLAEASETAVEALDEACKPVVKSLWGAVRAAEAAERNLSNSVASFSWKWPVVVGGAAAGGIAAVVVTGWLTVWWQRYQVEELAEQRAALVREVAELQANVEDWAKRGGRAKLQTCGDKGRLCVRVDKNGGFGKDADYYILKGY